ncbi:MAG: formylmethanofuran dehydrogenase subunit C [Gammaproteobacteria bacterium]
MTPLTLTLKTAPPGGLDLRPLTPARLAGRSLAQIERIRLRHGGRSSTLGKLFDVAPGDASELHLDGLTAGCHNVGAGMTDGRIVISGAVGAGLGRELRGGEIDLRGDAGDGVGLGMRGGVIRVRGSAGDRVGGAVPGQTRGMNEGVILVHGNVGSRAGERMRRGLIVVGGDAGRHVGDRMIAGTIVVLGRAAGGIGAGMRRGSLLLAARPAALPPGFRACGEFDFGFVPLLAAYLKPIDARFARRLAVFGRAERYAGDMAYGGNGEMLVASEKG